MLFIAIPNDEYQGIAKINGEAVEFKIKRETGTTPAQFWFRPGPGVVWEKRDIYTRSIGKTLTQYACASEVPEGDTVIAPTLFG